MKGVLHYVYDPLCGWCYAAEAMTDAVAVRAPGRFDIKLHAGGLFKKTHLPGSKRAQIRIADARIGEMTGQVFGDAYLNGLLSDPTTVYDSAQPIGGVLAAEALKPGMGLPMLKGLQRGHYRTGLRIVELSTILQVAESIGLDAVSFAAVFQSMSEGVLQDHLESTQLLMREVGARGYPTFIAQLGGRFQSLPHGRFYGDPEGFAALASELLAPQESGMEHTLEEAHSPATAFGRCDGDSCSL